MRRAIAVSAALLLTACGGAQLPTLKTGAGRASERHCADLVVAAYSSPGKEVSGAFGCLNADMRSHARAAGVNSDADFARLAQQAPVYTHGAFAYRRPDGGLVYAVDGPGHPPTAATLVIWITEGLISKISIV